MLFFLWRFCLKLYTSLSYWLVAECQCTICFFRASIHSLWICWLELALLHWEEPKDEIWKGMIIHIYIDNFYWSKPCALKYLYFIDCFFSVHLSLTWTCFSCFCTNDRNSRCCQRGGGVFPEGRLSFSSKLF